MTRLNKETSNVIKQPPTASRPTHPPSQVDGANFIKHQNIGDEGVYIKSKTIQVFDTKKVNRGDLITVDVFVPGDDGEYEHSHYVNGIVVSSYEEAITIIDINGNGINISIEDVLKGKYSIRGVSEGL